MNKEDLMLEDLKAILRDWKATERDIKAIKEKVAGLEGRLGRNISALKETIKNYEEDGEK